MSDAEELQVYLREICDLDVPIDIIDMIINYHFIVITDIFNSFIRGTSIPVIYDFGLDQTQEDRNKMLTSLSLYERNAICKSLSIILHEAGYKACISLNEIEDYMGTNELRRLQEYRDEEYDFSPDWRLTIFSGEFGTLYDFNGWPGDNEMGVGLLRLSWNFSEHHSDNLTEVYSNGDQSICPFIIIDPQKLKIFDEFETKRSLYYNELPD